MILGLRKVQLTGGSCYIGLPQEWVVLNEITPHQNLLIEALEDGSLRISKNEAKK